MNRKEIRRMTEDRKQIEKRRIKKQLKQSAADRYADQQTDIGALLDLIGQEARVHAERAAKEPGNWGYVGDAGHIRDGLKTILASLMIGRYEWSEAEASRFIEDHLEEMRNN
jgi:hypothetical protein